MWDKLAKKHAGETCIIIGNGPSLDSVPDEFLAQYVTFGTNRIFLRCIPSYYACVNPLIVNQDRLAIMRLNSALKFIPDYFGILGPGFVPLKMTGDKIFGDPLRGFYGGWTVTYVCLQIADYMGFDMALLVGVDHRYEYPDVRGGKEIVAQGPDPNHFSEDYFSNGYVWHAPDLEKSEEAYRIAQEHYTYHGKKIINLTENSALDVFPKRNLKEWI